MPSVERRPIGLALLLIVAGIAGWYAAFDLTLEKIQTLINPDYVPTCNISPLVTCGPNMASWQGSIFGFPNPVIGVAAFVAPVVVGVAILAGARFAKWFWVLFNLGFAAGIVFVVWLMTQSIFVLGTLCPYCMVVWAVVIPMFWYVTAFNLKEGHFGNGRGSREIAALLYPWVWVLVLLSYLVIVVMAQLRLDAITSIFSTL
ncbi:vitamin K epoxide reductase family protein [Herbiconiux sp. CPCC 203407]|uniref:Vitamin K epoxide reductase family protein n=1 Tax=Herbiconiux oxytropis TaxID=2970915 RepID=A0AA41XI76_9MICO|nr:vitamin K epoxide reductase family protein [Herbiconiux oxytropis]MCS5722616.1 vitamin K epoxide reductase family protein [Herbiconiux oxytropis]MCS5726370.1 vitamin K epoxide reductase family protein [Herbiconiux oxytropis]